MTKHLQYLWYLIRHKTFVFRAGLHMRVPVWLLIIHDWSKFTPTEWFPYCEHFYGADRGKPNRPGTKAFAAAWRHHIVNNPHHWNHWSFVGNSGKVTTHEMPERYVREMIADWMGAGRSITGKWDDVGVWFEREKEKMVLHPTTRELVTELMNRAKSFSAN